MSFLKIFRYIFSDTTMTTLDFSGGKQLKFSIVLGKTSLYNLNMVQYQHFFNILGAILFYHYLKIYYRY